MRAWRRVISAPFLAMTRSAPPLRRPRLRASPSSDRRLRADVARVFSFGVNANRVASQPGPAWRSARGHRGRMAGAVDPTKEAFAAFRADDRVGPIHMLNLVKLRANAAYPDERRATGAEAYAAYGRESEPVFSRLGGSIVWRGIFEQTLIGPPEERWDLCFIAQYPSVAAFVAMIRDPVYREAVKHRQAAVEDSRLIRLAPGAVGVGFG